MTQRDFLTAIARVLVAGALLALALRVGLGVRWFSFYGWATVALATVPFVTPLLWRRLAANGRSRWWTLAYAVPVLVLAGIQIGYWAMFFATGATNPSLGIVREMLRPIMDLIAPWATAALILLWAYVLRAALRSPAPAG